MFNKTISSFGCDEFILFYVMCLIVGTLLFEFGKLSRHKSLQYQLKPDELNAALDDRDWRLSYQFIQLLMLCWALIS